MIPIELFHDLAETLVAVVLFVPHILVVLDFPIPVKSQCNQTIDLLRNGHWLWCVLLLQLEDDLIWLR